MELKEINRHKKIARKLKLLIKELLEEESDKYTIVRRLDNIRNDLDNLWHSRITDEEFKELGHLYIGGEQV